MMHTVIEGFLRPEQEKSAVYVPFDVPPEAVRLDVSYWYSHEISADPLVTGGNTIDLGVFDQQGLEFLRAGFRGWSGSERKTFFITEKEATPGYLPGPILPGRWHLLLGLYKIGPEGCSYRVTITVATEPGHKPARSLQSSRLPASPSVRHCGPWLRGELHCHSWHSDGDSSPAEIVALACERGLDFLAITDHNTPSAFCDLAALNDPGLILIPGMEVTTFKGHFCSWGIGDWIDFRVAEPAQMTTALRYATERGALVSCNHPKPYGPPWDFTDVMNYDVIEVWNGPWFALNQMSLDFWARQLAAGRRIPAVAGSDWHRRSQMADESPRAPGTPCTWVYAPQAASADDILRAIRQGHVALSAAPSGPLLDLRAGDILAGDVVPRARNGTLAVRVHCQGGAGCTLHLLDQSGILWQSSVQRDDERGAVELPVELSLFVRAELRDADDAMKALTNPLYVE